MIVPCDADLYSTGGIIVPVDKLSLIYISDPAVYISFSHCALPLQNSLSPTRLDTDSVSLLHPLSRHDHYPSRTSLRILLLVPGASGAQDGKPFEDQLGFFCTL